MDQTEAAKRLWNLLDREHSGNTIVKDELSAMDWETLPPEVRGVLCGVAGAFMEWAARVQTRPPARLPDFQQLAAQAMVRAAQFESVSQWLADTMANAYKMGQRER